MNFINSRTFSGAAKDCACRQPQPGACGCLTFCHKNTNLAVAACRKHMADNAACKQPGVVCFGCVLNPHSDQAEYYLCH